MEMLFNAPDENKRHRASGMRGDLTIYERVARQASAAPGKVAMIDAKRQYPCDELAQLGDSLATNFLGMGIARGDVIAVQAPKWDELPLIQRRTGQDNEMITLACGARE